MKFCFKKITAALACLLFSCYSNADWVYSSTYDEMYETYSKVATLRGERAGNFLQILENHNGLFVFVAQNDINCFRECVAVLKFDENSPKNFGAQAPRIVSAVAFFINTNEIIKKLEHARKIRIRIPTHKIFEDIVLNTEQTFSIDKFNEAPEKFRKIKACQENAVNESYSDCIKRQ